MSNKQDTDPKISLPASPSDKPLPADKDKTAEELKTAEGNTTISEEQALAEAAAAKSGARPVDLRAGLPAEGEEKNTPGDANPHFAPEEVQHGRMPDAAKVSPELTPYKIPVDK